MWRIAAPSDDEAIERMCLALYAEDPGPEPVPAENIRRTLRALRDNPLRGRALVLELDSQACGYALVISYWSNELGGDIDIIDELYVERSHRGLRHATHLIEGLSARTEPWASNVVALALEVTPDNVRARRLYERLAFKGHNIGLRRLLRGRG
jgi:GNAT superfamily N-acetyltransferase